jgi:hypothetical protein
MRDPTFVEIPSARRFAGVHLSGPNAGKTAVVVLAGEVLEAPLKVQKVYEKIGAFGTLFSDERLFDILGKGGPFAEVFVDCPLTLPPCVTCQRPVCPGVVSCEDLSVAYMLSVSHKVRRKGARRARPVNPQSQRLWDVLQLLEPAGERLEPSYSANLAPLVARARTLQRRLNALPFAVELKETSVSNALELVRPSLKLGADLKTTYRDFEIGPEIRVKVLDRMIECGWIKAPAAMGEEPDAHAAIVETVEIFHAFICAYVAALHGSGLTRPRPVGYVEGEGWVILPTVVENRALPMPVFE